MNGESQTKPSGPAGAAGQPPSKAQVFLRRLASTVVLWTIILAALFSGNPLISNYVFLLIMMFLAGFGLAEFYGLVEKRDLVCFKVSGLLGGLLLMVGTFLNLNDALIPDATAVYFNAGDLGFGRNMNMKKSGDEFAFFVTNYKDADVALAKKGPVATVCMEFSRKVVDGKKVGNPYTKFYVYEHTNANILNDPLVSSADLDGFGNKFVPNPLHGLPRRRQR